MSHGLLLLEGFFTWCINRDSVPSFEISSGVGKSGNLIHSVNLRLFPENLAVKESSVNLPDLLELVCQRMVNKVFMKESREGDHCNWGPFKLHLGFALGSSCVAEAGDLLSAGKRLKRQEAVLHYLKTSLGTGPEVVSKETGSVFATSISVPKKWNADALSFSSACSKLMAFEKIYLNILSDTEATVETKFLVRSAD